MRRYSVLIGLLLLWPILVVTAQPFDQVYPPWEVNSIHDILHWNGDTVFACGNEWTLLRSVDAGQTWEEMFNYTNGQNIEAMTTDGRELFFYVRILTYGEYDREHFPITAYNPYTGALREIKMPTEVPPLLYSVYQLQATPGCLYVFGRQGTDSKVHKSTDNGITWAVVDLPGDALCTTWGNTMHFITDDIGFIICADTLDTYNRFMYRTDDGGKSWTKLTDIYPREDIKVKHVVGNGEITVYMGINLQVYKSTDSCKSWEVAGTIPWNSPTYPGIEALDFTAGGVGFVAGQQSDIYATSDGGSTWAQVKETTALDGTSAIQVLGNGVVISSNLPGQFYRSENSGVTWSSLRMPLFHSVRAFAFKDALHGVLVARDEAGIVYAYASSDGGSNWAKGVFIRDFYQKDSVNVGLTYPIHTGGDTIQFFIQEYVGT